LQRIFLAAQNSRESADRTQNAPRARTKKIAKKKEKLWSQKAFLQKQIQFFARPATPKKY
jgi:hypothetical protein